VETKPGASNTVRRNYCCSLNGYAERAISLFVPFYVIYSEKNLPFLCFYSIKPGEKYNRSFNLFLVLYSLSSRCLNVFQVKYNDHRRIPVRPSSALNLSQFSLSLLLTYVYTIYMFMHVCPDTVLQRLEGQKDRRGKQCCLWSHIYL